MCYLIVVAAAHIWIQGSNTLVTACQYKCDSNTRKVRTVYIDFDAYCPAQFEEKKK